MAEENDPLVQEVISHWTPSFTTNEIAGGGFNG